MDRIKKTESSMQTLADKRIRRINNLVEIRKEFRIVGVVAVGVTCLMIDQHAYKILNGIGTTWDYISGTEILLTGAVASAMSFYLAHKITKKITKMLRK